jgi:hypothetical protein
VVQLLVSRQVIQLPEPEDFLWHQIVPHPLWLLCIVIVLSNSLFRRQPTLDGGKKKPRWRLATAWLMGAFFALIILPDIGLIHFLVHIATHGIDAALPLQHRNASAFPDHQSENFRLFWLSVSSVAALVCSAAGFVAINRFESRRGIMLAIGVYILCLLFATIFCTWYYAFEFFRVSPYLASAGSPATWLDWLGAFVLAVFVVSVGACRLAESPQSIVVAELNSRERGNVIIHETFASQLLLVAAAIVYIEEMLRPSLGFAAFGTSPFWELFRYVFQDPIILLNVAICALSVKLAWSSWRLRDQSLAWKLASLDARKFFWNWLGLALLVFVGVPTISAYCFSFWLGPWYLYGN